jgi:hypothetical protein
MSDPTFQVPPAPPMPEAAPAAPRPKQYRLFAIGIFVLGLIGIGLGVAKILSFTTGAALCFFGILLFLLSLIPLPVVPHEEAPIPFLQKVFGVFYEPSRIFRNLKAYPYWVGAFVLVVVLNNIYSIAFVKRITPERIVNHTITKMGEMGPPFAPPPEALEGMRVQQLEALKSPAERVGSVAKSFVGAFVLTSIISAITLLMILAFGGRINFWQSLAISFWSYLPIVVIQKVLSMILLYVKSPDDLHPVLNQETLVQDNLGILFTPAEHPVLFVLASFIGLTSFYGLWLKAKGLQYGGTRVNSTAAWGASITLWLLLLLLVTIVTALFPSFIS